MAGCFHESATYFISLLPQANNWLELVLTSLVSLACYTFWCYPEWRNRLFIKTFIKQNRPVTPSTGWVCSYTRQILMHLICIYQFYQTHGHRGTHTHWLTTGSPGILVPFNFLTVEFRIHLKSWNPNLPIFYTTHMVLNPNPFQFLPWNPNPFTPWDNWLCH